MNYYYDTTGLDLQAFWSQTSADSRRSGAGRRLMGDSGDGTNSSGGFVFSTNGLWLEITGITNVPSH